MVNWKSLAKRIPHKVQVGTKSFYEVTWVSAFDDHKQVGQTVSNTKIIQLHLNQGDKDKVLTYLHEVMHAFSFEHGLNLTEAQVSKMERAALYYCIKTGNLFLK